MASPGPRAPSCTRPPPPLPSATPPPRAPTGRRREHPREVVRHHRAPIAEGGPRQQPARRVVHHPPRRRRRRPDRLQHQRPTASTSAPTAPAGSPPSTRPPTCASTWSPSRTMEVREPASRSWRSIASGVEGVDDLTSARSTSPASSCWPFARGRMLPAHGIRGDIGRRAAVRGRWLSCASLSVRHTRRRLIHRPARASVSRRRG
jgi:hypothetical protein